MLSKHRYIDQHLPDAADLRYPKLKFIKAIFTASEGQDQAVSGTLVAKSVK